MIVHGATVDAQTRCVHYSSASDVVAIRFACCNRWYPCHACHAEGESHAPQRWPRHAFDEHALLCGVCRTTLSIEDYLEADGCRSCGAPFNPGCRLHHRLYFDVGFSGVLPQP